LGEEGRQNKIDEAGLTLPDLCGFTVAQERDWQTLLLFNVALVEEFFKKELSPLDSHLEVPRLRGNVGGVHTKLKQLLLRVEFLLVGLLFDE